LHGHPKRKKPLENFFFRGFFWYCVFSKIFISITVYQIMEKIFTSPTLFLFFVVLIVWSRKVSYVIMTMKNSEFDDEIVEIYVNDYCPLCFCAEKIVRNQEESKDIVSDVFLVSKVYP